MGEHQAKRSTQLGEAVFGRSLRAVIGINLPSAVAMLCNNEVKVKPTSLARMQRRQRPDQSTSLSCLPYSEIYLLSRLQALDHLVYISRCLLRCRRLLCNRSLPSHLALLIKVHLVSWLEALHGIMSRIRYRLSHLAREGAFLGG